MKSLEEESVNNMSKNRYDGILGALYGFAIGDAMGATTEFMDEHQIKAKYGQVDNIVGGGWLKLEAGQVTDDTQIHTRQFNTQLILVRSESESLREQHITKQ